VTVAPERATADIASTVTASRPIDSAAATPIAIRNRHRGGHAIFNGPTPARARS
jgi:hypothetical protein